MSSHHYKTKRSVVLPLPLHPTRSLSGRNENRRLETQGLGAHATVCIYESECQIENHADSAANMPHSVRISGPPEATTNFPIALKKAICMWKAIIIHLANKLSLAADVAVAAM